jgi:dihydrofolate reductase
MVELIIGTFVSVDGVMQAPGGPDEDPSNGFEHGGWSFGYWDDAMGETIVAQMQRAEAFLLGRKTYEIFADHWPKVGDEDPVGAKLNSAPKYVASRTLRAVEWSNSILLEGDAATAVRDLKGRLQGEIQVHGSWGLLQTLIGHGLIDEYRLWVFPVLLGSGKRLFGDGTPPGGLALVDSSTSGTGVFMNRYRPAGEIRSGSFALD